MARKPIPGNVPPAPQKPIPGAPKKPKLWSFSFRFWKQIKNFGLDESAPKWFVSVLERFRELSLFSVDDFVTDGALQKNQRYHRIDWDAKNVPICRSDCDWIPRNYLNNEEEYPFVQFQVSRALGRVVGFWDENDVFNIILLDPLHNIQPSEYSAYRVRPCSPLDSEHVALLAKVDVITSGLKCERTECRARAATAAAATSASQAAIVVPLDETEINDLRDVLAQGVAKSANEVFVEGLLTVMERTTATDASAAGALEPDPPMDREH